MLPEREYGLGLEDVDLSPETIEKQLFVRSDVRDYGPNLHIYSTYGCQFPSTTSP